MRRLAKEDPARHFGITFMQYAGWWGLFVTAAAASGLSVWSRPILGFLSTFGFAALLSAWSLASAKRDR